MPVQSFDYGIIRLFYNVEKGLYLNAGVILFCRPLDFLGAKVLASLHQQLCLADHLDKAFLETRLQSIPLICEGGANSREYAEWSKADRFHWLTAPSSTMIGVSEIHSGICLEPAKHLNSLFEILV